MRFARFLRQRWVGLAVVLCNLLPLGCAVRRTTRIAPAAVPPPAVETSAADLAARLQKQERAIQTLTATVSLEPTAGSVYSGVIKQYHDVRAFVLVRSPDRIRMEGQAPVVRTTIFDMASDGKEFQVFIPAKQKFIVGSMMSNQAAKNSLENLRPQHILDALLLPVVDSSRERYFLSQEREQSRIYDQLTIVASGEGDQLSLKRRVWFDASTLDVSRVEFYNSKGVLAEDVHYTEYQDYQGVRYPSHIDLDRPAEDYSLGIVIEKATFNEPISAEKFVLQKPPNAEEIRLGARSSSGKDPGGQ